MPKLLFLIIFMSLFVACEKKVVIKKQIKYIVKLKNESFFSKKIDLINNPSIKMDTTYFKLQESYFKFSHKKKNEIPKDKLQNINALLKKHNSFIYPLFSKPNADSLYLSIPDNASQCYVPNLATYFLVSLELDAPESEIASQIIEFKSILNQYFTEDFLEYSDVRDDVGVPSDSPGASSGCDMLNEYLELRTVATDNRMKFQPYLRDLNINYLWCYAKTRNIGLNLTEREKIRLIGQGINFVDIEGGWEIRNKNYFNKDYQLKGQSNFNFVNHGTNTIGLVSSGIAPDMNVDCDSPEMRISGIAPLNSTWLISLFQPDNENVNVSTEQREWSVLLGIIVALSANNRFEKDRFHGGTVMLLEWSINSGGEKPFENENVIHDLIKMATHCLDFTVVEGAADNLTAQNLDEVSYNSFYNIDSNNFDDSGAIIVGSTNYLDPEPMYPNFLKRITSNYGKRVNAFIFGQNIFTTFPNNIYGTYENTSAAAAIIAGIATSLHWYAKTKYNGKIPALKMREFLTNNPQSINPSCTMNYDTYVFQMPNYQCLMSKVDNFFDSNIPVNCTALPPCQ